MIAWLRAVVGSARARLASRPDTEHEQGIVRLLVGLALGVTLLPGGLNPFGWTSLEIGRAHV